VRSSAPPKTHHPRLVRGHFQSELLKAFLKLTHKPLCLVPISKPTNKVIRIADGALLGLIAKWRKAGILEEDGQIVHPVTGTPQGGSVSPVLAKA
jgi:hypothetical protein